MTLTYAYHFRHLVPALAALMAPALVALTSVGASAVDWPTSYAQYNLAWDGGEMPKPTTYPSAVSWRSYNSNFSANGWYTCTVTINNDSAIIGTVMLRNPANGTWTDLGVPGSGFPFKYDKMDMQVNNLGTVAITVQDVSINPSGKEVMAYRRVGDSAWTAPTGTTRISQAWKLEYNGNRFLAGRAPSDVATYPEAGYWNTDGSFTNLQSVLGGVAGNLEAISGTKGWGDWGSTADLSANTFHFSVLSGIGTGSVTATEVLYMGTPAITKTVPLPQGGTVAINNVHDVAFVGDYAYINSHPDPTADDPAFSIKIPLTTIATDWSGAVAIPRPRPGDASMNFRGANTSGVVVGVASPFLFGTTTRDTANQIAFVYSPTSGTVLFSTLTGDVGYSLNHLNEIAEDGAMTSGPNLYVPVPTVNLTGIDTTVGPSDTTATVRLTRPTGTLGSTLVPLTCNLTIPVGVTVSDSTPTIPVGQVSIDVTVTILNTVYGSKTISLALPTIPGGNYYNQAGNAYNRGSNQNVVITNANVPSNPTPTLTRSGSGVTASPVPLSVSFDEAVNGFDVSDITVSTGTLSLFAGSSTSYSFTWTPPVSGTGSASVSIPAAAANAVDDAATSLASNTITISYDTQAPTVSIPDLASGSDLGTSSTDDLTGDNTPTFTGTAEADATVSLFVDAVLKGTAVATGGSWSITSSTLTDGAHNVTASAQDAAGNSSAVSSALAITIDTVVAVAITTSPASTVTTGTPTWSGTCDADATIAVTEGSTNLGAATVSGGTWSFTPASALADGNHTLVFTATDAAGAIATATASAVLVDAVGPVVALAGSDLIGKAGESIELTATYSDAGSGVASISLVDITGLTVTPSGTASATVVVSGSGIATRTITLTGLTGDGTLVINVNAGTALDGSALAATASNSVTVTVDSTVPADPTMTLANASNSGSTADLLTNVVRPIVNGVTDSGTTVTIREGSTVLGTATVLSTAWTFTPTTDLVGQGLHTLTATATDAAGNASAATALGVTIDTQITIAVTAASITTSSSSPTFSGTTDANETVTITGTGFTTISTTANGAGVWSVAGSGIAAGTYALTVTASDAAANSASTSLSLTIDQTAPTAPTTSASVLTNDTTPTLSGTAESGATITIAQGATVLGTATATGGNWTFTLTAPLVEGATTLTITATDSVGNVSTATTVTVTIDVTAPGLPTAVAPGTVTTATPTLTGTAEAGATVVIKEGATVLATVTANGSGAWTATLSTLANGLHTLAITAQDAAGNISAATAATVTVNVPAGSSSGSSSSSSGGCGLGSGTSASLLLFMSGLMFLRRRRKESV